MLLFILTASANLQSIGNDFKTRRCGISLVISCCDGSSLCQAAQHLCVCALPRLTSDELFYLLPSQPLPNPGYGRVSASFAPCAASLLLRALRMSRVKRGRAAQHLLAGHGDLCLGSPAWRGDLISWEQRIPTPLSPGVVVSEVAGSGEGAAFFNLVVKLVG